MSETKNVQNKVPAALVCEHRALKPGETPKRRGQKTIYESTGEYNPEFLERYETEKPKVTVKHDGTCTLLKRDEHGNLRLYKRYDVRKGKTPPENSIAAFTDVPEFYWIDITDSTDPSDQYHLASVTRKPIGVEGNYQITSIKCVVPTFLEKSSTKNKGERAPQGYQFLTCDAMDISEGTYELVGEKIQSNHHRMPTDINCDVMVRQSVKSITEHYLIPHGSFHIETKLFEENLPTFDDLREFIVDNQMEGIVFHFSDGSMYKVNRGHLNREIRKNDELIVHFTGS
jgi:hypothetical protein